MRWETSFRTKEVVEFLLKTTTRSLSWRATTLSWAWSFAISRSFSLTWTVTRKILAILSREVRKHVVIEMYLLHCHRKNSWTAKNTSTSLSSSIRRNPTMTTTSWLCLISLNLFNLNIIRSTHLPKVVTSCLKTRMVIILSLLLVLPTSTTMKTHW